MDVELGDDVAQGRDIDLVRAGDLLDEAGRGQDLGGELVVVGGGEVGELDDAGAARDQEQPVEAGVVLEAQLVSGQFPTGTVVSSRRGSST